MTTATWNAGVGAVAELRTLNRRILKQFMFCMADVDKGNQTMRMTSSIMRFSVLLHNITYGGGDLDKAPSQSVLNVLLSINTSWPSYKMYAENNVNQSPARKNTLEEMRRQSNSLHDLTERAVKEYMNAADALGVSIIGIRHDTAADQETLTESIAAQVTLLSFTLYTQLEKSLQLTELTRLKNFFYDAQSGLLDGLRFVGLSATTDRCTLNQMRTVSHLWIDYSAQIDNIVRNQSASRADVQYMVVKSYDLATETAKATQFYITKNNVCTYTVTITGWSYVIDQATRQQRQAMKATRLFLQVAKRVDTLDSRVLLSNALSSGREILQLLRYGDLQRQIPSPVTQAAADIYTATWVLWQSFQQFIEDQVAGVDPTSAGVLADVEARTWQMFQNTETALAIAVAECVRLVPDQSVSTSASSVPAKVVQVSGQQRVWLQSMSTRANLVGLAINVQANRQGMKVDIDTFKDMHTNLLFGNAALGLPATTQVCNLQLLKILQDLWEPFEVLMLQAYNGDTSVSKLTDLTKAQWIAGVDPIATAIDNCVAGFLDGVGKCDQVTSYREWEATIRIAGMMRKLTEKIGKEFMLVSQGINVSIFSADLTQSIWDFNYYRRILVRGSSSQEIVAPTSQGVVNSLFNDIYPKWSNLEDLMNVSMGHSHVSVESALRLVFTPTDALVSQYVIDAWAGMPTVRGYRINVSSAQTYRIQKIVKDALYLYYSPTMQGLSISQTIKTINDFDDANLLLMNGNGQVGQFGLKRTDEVEIMAAMNQLNAAWPPFKAKIDPIRQYALYSGTRPTQAHIQDLVTNSISVVALVDRIAELYGTMTTTTTTVLSLVFNPSNITKAQWEKGLELSGTLRALSEEMAKEFFMIAGNTEVATTRTSLTANIALFSSELTKLIDGQGMVVPPAPTQVIYDTFQTVLTSWDATKLLLNQALSSSATITTSNVMQVYNDGVALTSAVEAAITRYRDETSTNNAGIDDQQINTASRQGMYIQRVAKEVALIFILTGADRSTQVTNLAYTESQFSTSHSALLDGLLFVNLPASRRKCSLYQMRSVTFLWNNFTILISDIQRAAAVNPSQIDAVVKQTSALKSQLIVATSQYISQSSSCTININEEGWAFVIDEAALQQMHTLKAARLFLQVAGRVDTLDSNALLPNSVRSARTSLQQLREGDESQNIPSPVTETVALEYGTLWQLYQAFESHIFDFVQSVDALSTGVLLDVETQAQDLYAKAENAVELGVQECISKGFIQQVSQSSNSVPARVLQFTGRQRTLLQKMSFEANLVSLNINVAHNRDLILADVQLFDKSQEDLVFGNTTLGILYPTTQVCNLQTLKELQDNWEPYRSLIMQVYHGVATGTAQMVSITKAQWLAGVDPLATILNTLVKGYMDGIGVCSQTVQYREWENTIKESGTLMMLIERMMLSHLLIGRVINVTQNKAQLNIDIAAFEHLSKQIARGNASAQLPAPPNQAIVDQIFNQVRGLFDPYRVSLLATTSSTQQQAVLQQLRVDCNDQVARSEKLMDLYVDQAWLTDPLVRGSRVRLAYQQVQFVQKMLKEAMLLAWEIGGADLTSSILQFDQRLQQLSLGNNQVGKNYVKPTDEAEITQQMTVTIQTWNNIKPQFDTVAAFGIQGGWPTLGQLTNLVKGSKPLITEMSKTAALYGTMTTTTTTQLTLVFDTSNVTFDQWEEGFKQVGDVRIFVQILFKEFIFIAKGGSDVNLHRQSLTSTMTAVHNTIRDLMYGGANVHAAPVRQVWDTLSALNTEWMSYRTFLNDHMNSNSIAISVLLQGGTQNGILKTLSNQAVESYGDAIDANGVGLDVMQLNTARRQLSLNEEIIKETVFLSVSGLSTIDADKAITRLRSAKLLFAESHTGLLNGLSFVGLPATISKCTLNAMRSVDFHWEKVEVIVDDVLRNRVTQSSYVNQIVVECAGLGTSLMRASDLYRRPTTICPYTITAAGWGFVLQEASRQVMHCMKAVRLLLQCAKHVDVLDSRALLPNSLSESRTSLNVLRQGVQKSQIPSPVTEAVAVALGGIWADWESFQLLAENNKATITSTSTGLIIDIESLFLSIETGTTNTMNLIVDECILRVQDQSVSTSASSVPSRVLSVSGRQLSLLQITSLLANLIALGRNVASNQVKMSQNIVLFESSHEHLIFGNAALGLPATTQVCNLQSLKAVQDVWEPFKVVLERVLNGDTSVATLVDLTKLQWVAGIDPMADKVSKVVAGYLDGQGSCDQQVSYREWEAAIRTPAQLRTYIQMIAKEYLLAYAGIDANTNIDNLAANMLKCEHLQREIPRGNATAQIPAPESQVIVDKVFNSLFPKWQLYKAKLNTTQDNVAGVDADTTDLLRITNEITEHYIDDAYASNPTVLGARINVAFNQTMLLQQMMKEGVLLKFGIGGQMINNSMKTFEDNDVLLRNGNGHSGKTRVKSTDEAAISAQMVRVQGAWASFKPKLEQVAIYGTIGGFPSNAKLEAMITSSITLVQEMDVAASMYGMLTTTTTTALVLVFDPANITNNGWKYGIQAVGSLRSTSQILAKYFMFIAADYEKAVYRSNLTAHIGMFSATLSEVIDGNPTKGIPSAPVKIVWDRLQAVSSSWLLFKNVLEAYMNAGTIPDTIIKEINQRSLTLLSETRFALEGYADAMNQHNFVGNTVQLDTAMRQSMLIEKMGKEAILLRFAFWTSAERLLAESDLRASGRLYIDSHRGLLNGLNFVSLASTSDKCTLNAMRTVSVHSDPFVAVTDNILRMHSMTQADVPTIAQLGRPLRIAMERAVMLYIFPSSYCPYTVDPESFAAVIDFATQQLMHAVKAVRLYLQTAKRVDTLDSRALAANSLRSARSDLQTLREGDVSRQIPSPLTEAISLKYGLMWDRWVIFQTQMETNLDTIGSSSADVGLLIDAENDISEIEKYGNEAVKFVVEECILRVPDQSVSTSSSSVPARVLWTSGMQRAGLQKMSLEAVLIGLGRNVQTNRRKMLDDVRNFEESHFNLVFGNASVGLPPTVQVCNLQSLKEVQDKWETFKPIIMRVYNGDASIATLTDITKAQWNAGTDPFYVLLTNSVQGFMTGGISCGAQVVTYKEWEAAVRTAAVLRTMSQKFAKALLLRLNDLTHHAYLNEVTSTMSQSLTTQQDLTRGSAPQDIPAPPSQSIVDLLFNQVFTQWDYYSQLINTSIGTVNDIRQTSQDFLTTSTQLTNMYVDEAWTADTSVRGTRIKVAGEQVMLLQKMLKEAVLLQHGIGGAMINTTIQTFTDNNLQLRAGNNLVGKGQLKLTDEVEIASQMKKVEDEWDVFKPKINAIAFYGTAGGTPSISHVNQVNADASILIAAVDRAAQLYGTMTTTTTTALNLVFNPSNLSTMDWSNSFHLAGELRIWSRKIAKEFIYVAKGLQKSKYRADVTNDLNQFQQGVTDLIDGSPARGIPSAPVRMVYDGLQDLLVSWTPFKILVENHVQSNSISISIVQQLVTLSDDLKTSTDFVVTRFKDAARANAVALDMMQLDTASRQPHLVEEMSMQALYLSFQQISTADKDAMLIKLQDSTQLFYDSHQGLLNGLNFVGLPATSDKCTLNDMRTVTDVWETFETVLDQIIRDRNANANIVQQILAQSAPLAAQYVIASNQYRIKNTVCPYTITDQGWSFVIDEAAAQQAFSMKATRLFLQVARSVDTLDSRVLTADALRRAREALLTLRQGDISRKIPSPVTQNVATAYFQQWNLWSNLQIKIENNANTISHTDHGIIQDIQREAFDLLTKGDLAVQLTVDECLRLVPDQSVSTAAGSVPSKPIQVAGRQRTLLQKMSMEANLVALNVDVQNMRDQMHGDVMLYEDSHYNLVFGNSALGLPATTKRCILQRFKEAQDNWGPFKVLIMKVYNGDTSIATLTDITKSQWNAGVDPMATVLTDVVQSFLDGTTQCPHTETYREWEAAVRTSASLSLTIESASKHLLLTLKGINVSQHDSEWNMRLTAYEKTKDELVLGNLSLEIPSPTSQRVVDKLFNSVFVKWLDFKELTNASMRTPAEVQRQTRIMHVESDELTTMVVEDAFAVRPDVRGTRIKIASNQEMLLQKMLNEALLMSFGVHTNLTLSISTFDTHHNRLRNGYGAAGTINYLKSTDEVAIIQQMSLVTAEWLRFKPSIQNIASLGGMPSKAALNDVVVRSSTLERELRVAAQLYGTMTTTTTTKLNLVFTPSNVTDLQWKTGLNMAGQQRLLSQKIAKEFFMVAKNIHKAAFIASIKSDVAKFSQQLNYLISGSWPNNVAPAPVRMIWDGLQDVKNAWSPFDMLVSNNVDLAITTNHLLQLKTLQQKLYEDCDVVASRYEDSAKANQAQVDGLRINTANRQLGLSQKMALEIFVIDAGLNVSLTIGDLRNTQQLFSDSHSGILEGLDFVGLQPTSEMCTLAQMRRVTYEWDNFSPWVQKVIRDGLVDVTILQDVRTASAALLNEMNLAVDLYVTPQTFCPANVSALGWEMVLKESSRQAMSLQKAARLFLQAARRVDTLDSRVLLSDALVGAKSSLKLMKEGSLQQGFPSPVTQRIATELGTQWSNWLNLEDLMANNVQTVDANDTAILSDIDFQSSQLYVSTADTRSLLVTECQNRTPHVQAVLLTTVGRQRTLFQKMSKEAVLMGLGINTVTNRNNMYNTVILTDQSHHDIVHGRAPDIPRTTQVCTMQQMKKVHDLWLGLKDIIMHVYNGDTSIPRLVSITKAQWNAGVDPIATAVDQAMDYFTSGGGLCFQTPSATELEHGIKFASELRMLSQRISKEFFYVTMGLNASAYSQAVIASMAEFIQKLNRLISGWTADHLPAPTTQNSLDSLLRTKDRFLSFQALVTGQLNVINGIVANASNSSNSSNSSRRLSSASVDVAAVNVKGLELLNDADNATVEYVNAAWTKNQSVRGARSNMAGQQLMLLERMSKDAALVSIGNAALQASSRSDMSASSSTYDSNHNILRNGNGQTGIGGIRVTDEEVILKQLNTVQAQWNAMKTDITGIANGGSVGMATLNQLSSQQAVVTASQQNATASFSTVIMTTTKSPVDILVPLPTTGRWRAGPTMRLAATVAENIMNTEQVVLPGYLVKQTFLDDRCDPDWAMRIVLEQFALSTKYVGLGGMGCNKVCSSLAIVTSSMGYPTLSYDCSGDNLADTALYPDFTRLGVKTTYAPKIIAKIMKMFGWASLEIISEDPAEYRLRAETYVNEFASLTVAASYVSTVTPTLGAALGMMQAIMDQKKRHILVMGNSSWFRRLVCAAVQTNNNGLTWFSVEVLERSWWTIDEAALIAEQPACTGQAISSHLQGAINIAGVGAPPASAPTNMPLTCFPQHTAASLRALINSYLHVGYGPNNSAIAHPFDELMAFSVDGTCAFALTIKHMIAQGHNIASLRSPSTAIFRSMRDYMKQTLDFEGLAGRISFSGNDYLGRVGIFQVRQNASALVGTSAPDGNVTVSAATGLRNNSWTAALPDKVDPGFPWVVLPISVAGLFACLALCMGLRRGALESRGSSRGENSKSKAAASNGRQENEDSAFVEAVNLPIDSGIDDLRNSAAA